KKQRRAARATLERSRSNAHYTSCLSRHNICGLSSMDNTALGKFIDPKLRTQSPVLPRCQWSSFSGQPAVRTPGFSRECVDVWLHRSVHRVQCFAHCMDENEETEAHNGEPGFRVSPSAA